MSADSLVGTLAWKEKGKQNCPAPVGWGTDLVRHMRERRPGSCTMVKGSASSKVYQDTSRIVLYSSASISQSNEVGTLRVKTFDTDFLFINKFNMILKVLTESTVLEF